MTTFPFQVKRFGNYGSAHPAVARLFLQMTDLLDATDLSPEERDQVGQHLFRCVDELVKAEERKNTFVARCEQFHQDVRAGHSIRQTGGALQVDEPAGLGDDYELFLIRLAIALRMAIKAAKIVLGLTNKKDWGGFKKAVVANFGVAHPLTKVIQKHDGWSSDLFDLRGDVEHDPYIFQGFKVLVDPGQVLRLVDPELPDGRPAPAGISTYYEDGFAFAEELVLEAIKTRLPSFATVKEIPADQRDPGTPVRFVIDLKPGVLPG